MKTMLLKLLGRIGLYQPAKPSIQPQPKPHTKIIVIEPGMTESQFAKAVASCFVGVDRPEKFTGDVKIFEKVDDGLVRLTWGEMESAVGFFARYGITGGGRDEWGIALVELPVLTYQLLKSAYQSIGKPGFDAFVGKHELDMTPIKSWFPACS